jgi:cytochrome c peroxidase
MKIPKIGQALCGCVLVLALSACEKSAADAPFAVSDNTPYGVLLTETEIIQKYLNLDPTAFPNYTTVAYPAHYTPQIIAATNTPAANRVTNAGATLGRVLFYDRNLSINNTVNCASCHAQNKGFSDDRRLSTGFAGGLTGAHSMRLTNALFYTDGRMFWDKRATNIENQSTQPVKDMTEMGFTVVVGGADSLVRKLNKLEYYPILFNKAFGTTQITEARMQAALAQYIRSIVSKSSKFDSGYAAVFNRNQPNGNLNANFANYTAVENQGKALFLGQAGCQRCHVAPTFALTNNSLSNGLDATERRIFKSPSLKSVGAAASYMHDGRFQNLTQVVNHYNNGIRVSPSLDNRLRGPNGQPQRLNLSPAQVTAIVAFMNTLTDHELSRDTRFNNPFKL